MSQASLRREHIRHNAAALLLPLRQMLPMIVAQLAIARHKDIVLYIGRTNQLRLAHIFIFLLEPFRGCSTQMAVLR